MLFSIFRQFSWAQIEFNQLKRIEEKLKRINWTELSRFQLAREPCTHDRESTCRRSVTIHKLFFKTLFNKVQTLFMNEVCLLKQIYLNPLKV